MAAVASSFPLREHSHLDLHPGGRDAASDAIPLEDRLCPGCKKFAVNNEQGGLVVAFGQSFFHVDCFKCAKCRNQVTADTNLLLLSDGSPICANCSYSCNVCKQPILDEAIMAGDDSYHAHCFKCKVCKNRIDELVFAKTSNGIYCMKCHNERMIRIRKHTQKKAERDKAHGGSGSSKSRERVARDHHRENNLPPSPVYDALTHSFKPSNPNLDAHHDSSRRPLDQTQPPSRSNTTPPYNAEPIEAQTRPSPSPNNHNVSVTVAPPAVSLSHTLNDRGNPAKQHTLPPPGQIDRGNYRRSLSFDDGLKPPEESSNPPASHGYSIPSGANTLSVTSRQQKRRSINPGLTLSPFSEPLSSIITTTSHSPRSDVFPISSTPTAPGYNDPRPTSPLADQTPSSRRMSHANSSHSVHSLSIRLADNDPSRSPSPSITTQDYDQQDDTVIMRSPLDMAALNPGGSLGEGIYAGISPDKPKASLRSQKRSQRSSAASGLSLDIHRSGSRSASPAHPADVPHSVESGTDTEPEGEGKLGRSLPPALPPKDKASLTRSSSDHRNGHSHEGDISQSKEDLSDVESSSPVERFQTSTFIAPALPPIRFSLNPVEFSDLLNSVNNKPMTNLANLQKLALEASPSSSSTPLNPVSNFWTVDEGSQPATPTAESSSSQGHASASDSLHSGSFEPRSSQSSVKTQVTITGVSRSTSPDVVTARLREAIEDSKDRNSPQLKVDRVFMVAILQALDARNEESNQMKTKLDGMRRASKQYIEGLTVAQTEYDRELKSRRDVEAEVTRLRVLLSGQAARLTQLSGDTRRHEARQQMSKELNDNLSGLEEDLSKLKTERDVTLAEIEELSVIKSSGNAATEVAPATLGRALTKRLDTIRTQYSRDLVPLQQQREQLLREIVELKAERDVFLEETATLHARNEQLAELSTVYTRRIDTIPETLVRSPDQPTQQRSPAIEKLRQASGQGATFAPSLSASTSSSTTIYEDHMKVPGSIQEMHTPAKNKFKWPGSKTKEMVSTPNGVANGVEFSKGKAHIEHNFQQLSVLRFTRCDHCGDKMWGSQLKCTVCSTSIHVRCIANVHIPCSQSGPVKEEAPPGPLPPSMFGRDLIKQVRADSKDGDRLIPVIVEKCIDAVDALALDYEGIYRKTGGSTQTKGITQLFERGDYSSFDLLDTDRFNDICSVTSVLKNYFRSLPIPLLTFDLHDQFITSASIRDQALKHEALLNLVNNLPDEHYYTLRKLMIHLHKVRLRCEKNRMTSRNLGVVFGPTLMRSRDPGAEFSDMAGKALFIEWLIDNAPEVFKDSS